jgi:hypothetical protein
MGVYFPDEFLSTCLRCVANYDDTICRATGELFDDEVAESSRMPNCPAINVPPHGDLIDRTALRLSRMMMEFDKVDGDKTEHVKREFYWADVIDGAPVVIPRG